MKTSYLLTALLSAGLIGAISPAAELVFEETFEDCNPGPVQGQGGWKLQQLTSKEPLNDVMVVDDPGLAFKGRRFLAISGGHGWTEPVCVLKQIPFDETENNLVAFHLRFDQPGKSGLQMAITANSGADTMVCAVVNAAGALLYKTSLTSAWQNTDAKITPDEWHRFQYRILPDARKYEMQVSVAKDQTPILKTTLPMVKVDQTPAKYWTLHFIVDNVAGCQWLIDDLSIGTPGK